MNVLTLPFDDNACFVLH